MTDANKRARIIERFVLILFSAAAVFLLAVNRMFLRTIRYKDQYATEMAAKRPLYFGILLGLTLLQIVLAAVHLLKIRRFAEEDVGLLPTALTDHAVFPYLQILITAAAIPFSAWLCFNEVEIVNNIWIMRMEDQYRLLGFMIPLAFFLFFILVLNSPAYGCAAGFIFFMVWGLVNYYVQQFRSVPFQWIAIFSVRTAMNVASNYTVQLVWQSAGAGVLTLNMIAFALRLLPHRIARNWPVRIGSRAAAACVGFLFVHTMFGTSYLADQGIWLRDWQPWYTYRLFGMEAGFLAFARASYPQPTEGYSEEAVASLIEETRAATEDMKQAGAIPDNIIVVMNESFSKLDIYPNVVTDVPVTPFLDSLTENAVQGNLLVSVLGGTTANTEYEFLTGNSMVLSPQTVVYNSFIKDDQYSLARTLKTQGYRAVAVHPYMASGWNRQMVYPFLGFDEFISVDDFENAGEIRKFVSDRADYEKLISLVESKEEGEKLFIFNVTMQNHGGYKDESLASTVDLLGYDGPGADQAEQYETLIRLSDEALEFLITYFKAHTEERTLIVFFGDHQPALDDDFFEYAFGNEDSLTFEQQQMKYKARYLIWANYPLQGTDDLTTPKPGETLSANMLSSLMMSYTGLEKTDYQKYLLHLRETIPAMNAYGYLGGDGEMHEWIGEEAGAEEKARLNEYEWLIYNELTAGDDRDASFFGISR